MCGICGVVGLADAGPAVEAMLGRLGHRGPDNKGIWNGPGASLGHARLAIVDLSPQGNQPMSNEDDSLWLVANGEIYNSPQLTRELQAAGHRFKSRSDSEVLLHAYEEQGDGFLVRLNAMLAFALWDAGKRRLLLARDRLGIKPLYFMRLGEGLAFASEIKALLACPGARAAIDPVGLNQYLAFENTFGARTLHSGIEMVEPGQAVVWQDGRLNRRTYWEPRIDLGQGPDFDQACRRYQEVARAAVERHLMSDVEVACYLSAGFDSSAVATMAAGGVKPPLRTFTGRFDRGGWYDESAGARAVAESVGSLHTEVSMGADDLRSHLDDIIHALDEPRMGPGSFSQYMVARQAARQVRVILTGHGGDELFAGYPVFKYLALRQGLTRDPAASLALLGRVAPAEWPHLVYFLGQDLRRGERARFLPRLFPSALLQRALQPSLASQVRDLDAEEELDRVVGREPDPYRRLTRIYLRAYLPGLFVVEDKISMAHALESRTPLCDNELVELALEWPLALKLHGGQLKAIPKAALRGLLPPILYGLPKRGFPTPLAPWFRGDLSGWLRQRLCGQDSRLPLLFTPSFLETSIQAYLGSWRRRVRPLDEIQTHRIWQLLSLEAWLRLSAQRLGQEVRLV